MKHRELVANNLRRLMKETPELGTQLKIQHIAGVSQSSVSRILKAETPLSLDLLALLAEAFECDISEFFYSADAQPSPEGKSSNPDELDFSKLSKSQLVELVKLAMEQIDSIE